ncbi:MAG: hypothetical protein NTW87_09045 [Planctomycetota bacterium]|nr:hypothetical protein [Planctomycetota bacterium]
MNRIQSQALTTVVAVAAWIGVCCSGAEPAPEKKAGDAPKAAQGDVAIKQAAEAQKHLYILFYGEDNEAAGTARKSLEAVVAKMADVAQYVALDRDAPAQKALVEKYDLKAAPMPLVLVLAPNGAVTMGCLAQDMNEEKLRDGIASPCQQNCLKALQDNKIVVLCAYDKTVAADDPSVKAVNDFHADAKYAKLTEVVRVDPADAAEARFLKQLQVDSKSNMVTVILGPPRVLVKTFTGPVAKDALEGALKSGSG